MIYTNIRLESYFIEWFVLQIKKKQGMKQTSKKSRSLATAFLHFCLRKPPAVTLVSKNLSSV